MLNNFRRVPSLFRRLRSQYVLAECLPDGTLVDAKFETNQHQTLKFPRLSATGKHKIIHGRTGTLNFFLKSPMTLTPFLRPLGILFKLCPHKLFFSNGELRIRFI